MHVLGYAVDDQTKMIIIISIIVVSLLLLLGISLVFVISSLRTQKYQKEIDDLKTTTRVFIIDIKNDTVKYFDRSKLHVVRTSSLIKFYNNFASRDRVALIEWIGDLLNQKTKTNPYLELSIIDSARKRLTYSILQVHKIDHQKQLIHIESFLLRIKNNFETRKKPYIRFLNESAFYKTIKTSSMRGSTICLDLFYKSSERRNEDIPHIVFAQVRNHVLNYVLPTRPIYPLNEHQIIISDLKYSNHSRITRFITELKINISRILMLSGNVDDIDFVFSVVPHRFFPQNPEKLITIATTTAELTRDTSNKICWYSPELALELDADKDVYRSEVERIIHDNRITFKYRPVYNCYSHRVIGYESFIEPDDSTMFESLEALKNYAIRTDDDRELFSNITRKAITRFIQEKDGVSLRIFYPISYKERAYVIRTLSYIQKIKETHVVIVFDEQEILNLVARDVSELLEYVVSFKTKGYEVGINFKSFDLPFSEEFYRSFDYYIIDNTDSLTAKTSSKKLSNFYAFAEKLFHYQKTIIASNLLNWDNVELMLKLGLPIVSSNSISEPSEMIQPISQKSLKRIKKIVESQGVRYGK